MESSDLTVWKSLEVERFQIFFFEISHRDFLSCNGNEPLSESIITMTKQYYKIEIYILVFLNYQKKKENEIFLKNLSKFK